MKSIKIVGIVIPIVAIILAYLSNYLNEQNIFHKDTLNRVNNQKAFTQEVSKNIFYIYKNKNSSNKYLEDAIKMFLNAKSMTIQQDQEVITLWNKFYLNVQQFRDNLKSKNVYSNILLEKIVKNIYNINLKLVVLFDKKIEILENNFKNRMKIYRYIEYGLYLLLISLLIYLATKLHDIVEFIQRFLKTSDSVLQNSTIKGLEPIEVKKSDEDLQQASENFNILVQKINSSIDHSTTSLEHSYRSLESVEESIENFLELINSMNDTNLDKDLSQKEDAVIESLEEILKATENLKNLKVELKNLIG